MLRFLLTTARLRERDQTFPLTQTSKHFLKACTCKDMQSLMHQYGEPPFTMMKI